MKTFIGILSTALFSLVIFSGCSQKSVVVATDKNLEDAEFDEYSTFTFASHIEDATDNSFFWESKDMKDVVKEEVKEELQALGYRYVEGPGAEADLLVNFQVLDEETELTGWIPDYTNTTYWGGIDMDVQDREPEDRKTYYLDKGTIIVHLADMEEGLAVWRGYASGIVETTSLTDEDEVRIDEAVEKIFNEFDYTASR